ncbi:MAG: histidine phosphatase family protein [Betaproteobacteria bacterium]
MPHTEGRAQARRIGEAFRKRQVPVGRVLSSPWCRCVETAKLAFGRTPEISPAPSNLFGRHENRDAQVKQMRPLIRAEKGNLALVSHGVTIAALTGVSPATGETVVLTPQGKGSFAVRGRLLLD